MNYEQLYKELGIMNWTVRMMVKDDTHPEFTHSYFSKKARQLKEKYKLTEKEFMGHYNKVDRHLNSQRDSGS